MFIRLTKGGGGVNDGKPIWIEFGPGYCMFANSQGTTICPILEREGQFQLVKESPEEILALIEAQKPKLDIDLMVQVGIADFFDKLWRTDINGADFTLELREK